MKIKYKANDDKFIINKRLIGITSSMTGEDRLLITKDYDDVLLFKELNELAQYIAHSKHDIFELNKDFKIIIHTKNLKKYIMKHPKGLYFLFFTEMWERFGYYGMRAILTLYLANHFLFSDTTTAGLYGGFTALVYLTPLVGGLIADNYLGSKRSVKFGAIMMSIGYFILAFSASSDSAKPFSTIDGQKYEITVEGKGEGQTKFVTLGGQKLQIQGNEDKSVSLLSANEAEVRKFADGEFKSDGERSPFFVLLLLPSQRQRRQQWRSETDTSRAFPAGWTRASPTPRRQ